MALGKASSKTATRLLRIAFGLGTSKSNFLFHSIHLNNCVLEKCLRFFILVLSRPKIRFFPTPGKTEIVDRKSRTSLSFESAPKVEVAADDDVKLIFVSLPNIFVSKNCFKCRRQSTRRCSSRPTGNTVLKLST